MIIIKALARVELGQELRKQSWCLCPLNHHYHFLWCKVALCSFLTLVNFFLHSEWIHCDWWFWTYRLQERDQIDVHVYMFQVYNQNRISDVCTIRLSWLTLLGKYKTSRCQHYVKVYWTCAESYRRRRQSDQAFKWLIFFYQTIIRRWVRYFIPI